MDLQATEVRAGRLRKSCEPCRGSKARCCPSVGNDERCHRCAKEGKQCVFLEAKPRQKRARSSRLRVTEMEAKLENLYALLSKSSSGSEATKEDHTDDLTDAPPEPLENVSTYSPYFDTITTFNHVLPLPDSDKTQLFPVFPMPYLVFDKIGDAISKGIVSFADGEECLTSFQKATSAFPFVVIAPHTSLDTLRREKPCLLLAILAFGSRSHPKTQSTLEDEFREMVSKKIIMNGEKSLDLLQGLLVYLNWYHLYFKLGNQQIYQLSQVAATMAVDLHIHHNRQSTSRINSLAIPIPGAHIPEIGDGFEGKRTFLGAYYLTSAICLCLRKPYTLKHSEYVEECSQLLGQIEIAETDYLIPFLISIQHFIEEAMFAFQCNVPQKLQPSDSARIATMYNGFKHRLSQVEMSIPCEIRKHPIIAISLQSSKIYMTEVGFHASFPTPFEMMSEHSAPSWYYSTARSEVILSCQQATKDYLDLFLVLPNDSISNFGLPDFLRLLYAVLVLGVYITGCDAPALDDVHMRKTSNLSNYLDALNTKTTSMITYTGSEEKQDYMWHLRCMLQKTKSWYNSKAVQSQSPGYLELGSADLAYMGILACSLETCADESLLSKHTDGNSRAAYSAPSWFDVMSDFPLSVDDAWTK